MNWIDYSSRLVCGTHSVYIKPIETLYNLTDNNVHLHVANNISFYHSKHSCIPTTSCIVYMNNSFLSLGEAFFLENAVISSTS